MADPICRWRNTTPDTVKELVRILPKSSMKDEDFKNEVFSNCEKYGFGYDGFFSTAYQLAVQIGLYYIDDDGIFHPRFDHDLTNDEANEYVSRVACLYVSPNPYARSMRTASDPVALYDYFVQCAGAIPSRSLIDVKEALSDYYKIPVGNVDMVVNLLARTGSFEKVDGQHLRYVGFADIASDKEKYFKHFGMLLHTEERAAKSPPNDCLSSALKLFEEHRHNLEWCADNTDGDATKARAGYVANAKLRVALPMTNNLGTDAQVVQWFKDYTYPDGKSWLDGIDTNGCAAFGGYINYLVTDSAAVARPEKFTRSLESAVKAIVKPASECFYNKDIHSVLKYLGLLGFDFKEDFDEDDYQDALHAQRVIKRRLKDMGEKQVVEWDAAANQAKPNDKEPDFLTVNEFLWFVKEHENLIKEKVMASVYKKTEIAKVAQKKFSETEVKDFKGFIDKLEKDVADVGLKYAPDLMKRFVCAQLAKPFVVLTGLSGSGKTKLAEAFTKWIGVKNTVNVVPVGADWTNNEKLLGYPNALDPEKYVMPDTGVLKLMLDANENQDLPFFLILDEMNLSHVERYFADFLSTMESHDGIIELYDSGKRYAEDGREIPPSFKFPKNLFVIGTMNVDETTYMFSPKVLDRAQVIEFRVSEKEMADFLTAPGNPKINDLAGKGAVYANAFLDLAKARKTKDIGADEKKKFNELLIGKVDPKTKEYDGLFTSLAKLGAEFGYRSAIEMVVFIAYYLEACAYGKLTQSVDKEKCLGEAIDAAVLQKLLPKLHGSLNRLGPVIDALIGKVSKPALQPADSEAEQKTEVAYPLTYEKLQRMKLRVEKNGFTSFAEA